ncbi:MAG: hypothetical protein U5M53_03185 [Rhodoferax sp.]|nr:hypothetical protein [Rhodoferax sp.]
MVTIAATSTATPSLQSTLSRSRLEQARREADSAESRAESLRRQADDAERDAQNRNNNVKALNARETGKDSTYTTDLRRNTDGISTETLDFLERMYEATSPQFAASGNALKADAGAPAIVNTQGQSTGRILNLSA